MKMVLQMCATDLAVVGPKVLTIMKDSAIGAYGAIGLVLLLLNYESIHFSQK
jgi:cobalamin synthase